MPPRPAQPCKISALPVHTTKASCQRYKHTRSLFCWAMNLRLAQPCTILTLQAHAPKACQARDVHMHNLRSTGTQPPSLSSWGSTDTQHLHSACLCPSGMASPRSKGPLLHLSFNPPPVGPWDPTHHPLATERLQAYLRETHRQEWVLKN
jgi:hypothetical protein